MRTRPERGRPDAYPERGHASSAPGRTGRSPSAATAPAWWSRRSGPASASPCARRGLPDSQGRCRRSSFRARSTSPGGRGPGANRKPDRSRSTGSGGPQGWGLVSSTTGQTRTHTMRNWGTPSAQAVTPAASGVTPHQFGCKSVRNDWAEPFTSAVVRVRYLRPPRVVELAAPKRMRSAEATRPALTLSTRRSLRRAPSPAPAGNARCPVLSRPDTTARYCPPPDARAHGRMASASRAGCHRSAGAPPAQRHGP
jgi:hypothetical protein